MGALTFTYNSVTQTILNQHTLRLEDDKLSFDADFLLTAASDSAFATAAASMLASFSEMNKNFTLDYGGNEELTWSHSANTGFLTRPAINKPGSPEDSDKSAMFRFSLTAERPPQDAARAGRRQAQITIAKPAPDNIRQLTFEGTWTANGANDALTEYTANVQDWIDGWLSTLSTTGIWQKVGEPQVSFDDENKVLRFQVRYDEKIFTSTPGETTVGIYTLGSFVRADPERFGIRVINNSGPGAGSGVPRFYSVQTKTFLNDLGVSSQNDYWESTIRPWIDATVAAMFDGGRAVYKAHTVPMADVQQKSIACNALIMVADNGQITAYEEDLTFNNDRRLLAENVWDGRADSYDLNEGGRRLEALHTIRQTRLDQAAPAPEYLPGPPWEFLRELAGGTKEVLDPVTGQIVAFVTTHRREYLFAQKGAAVPGRVAVPGRRQTQGRNQQRAGDASQDFIKK